MHYKGTSSTSESRGWSGKNTLEYERIKTNLSSIITALQSNPSARNSLRQKFKEKGWLSITESPTEEQLVTHALGRIELDPKQYRVFLVMLRDVEGLDLIVNRLTGMTIVPLPVSFCMRRECQGRTREEGSRVKGKILRRQRRRKRKGRELLDISLSL